MGEITARSIFLVLCLTLFPAACASMGDMPQSAEEVDFSSPDGPRDDESWAAIGYQVTYDFPFADEVDFDIAMRAAIAGITYTGLEVVKVDAEHRTVIGHRAANLDHSVEYAGVYLAIHDGRMRAKIYVSGETAGRWGERKIGEMGESIKTGITIFLESESRVMQNNI